MDGFRNTTVAPLQKTDLDALFSFVWMLASGVDAVRRAHTTILVCLSVPWKFRAATCVTHTRTLIAERLDVVHAIFIECCGSGATLHS